MTADPLPAPPAAALERVRAAAVTLVIGPSDAGKSTLVTGLARALAEDGVAVGIVDADLGQSEIGPPTTIGLGRATPGMRRLSDAEPVALHFVGVTSPARNITGALVGARRMLDRARADCRERVLIDTSGLVAGELGRVLKQAKIDLLDPDLVIALDRGGACDLILRPYTGASRPAVLSLPAPAVGRRSQDDRRRYRARALAAYLAPATSQTLDLRRVVLRQPPLLAGVPIDAAELLDAGEVVGRRLVWGERRGGEVVVVGVDPLTPTEAQRLGRLLGQGPAIVHALADLEGMLAGLEDEARETLGIGVVQRISFETRELTLLSPIDAARVAVVTVGRERFDSGGQGPDASGP